MPFFNKKNQKPTFFREISFRMASKKRKSVGDQKPLAGVFFYLDIPNNSERTILEAELSELGGTVFQTFDLSKITHLVTTKNVEKSTGIEKETIKGNTVSRKKRIENIVESSLEQARDDILILAKSNGKKICPLFKVLSWIESYRKKKEISEKPKFELSIDDCSGHFKPLVKEFNTDRRTTVPQINADIILFPSFSPFIHTEDAKILWKKKEDEEKQKKLHLKELKPNKPTKDKKHGGWCECCLLKYTGTVEEHLSTWKHKEFASNVLNYKEVDILFGSLPEIPGDTEITEW
jgi:hypothetical protein